MRFQWRIGSSLARSLALPASHGGIPAEAGHWPKGQTGTIFVFTLRGRQIAYSSGLFRLAGVAWRPIERPVPESFCSLEHPLC